MYHRTYLVFCPSLDQSLTIAKFLRKYNPDVSIFGVTLEDKRHASFQRIYDRTISSSYINSFDTGIIPIPTGAKSTRLLLQRGDVTLGSITLTQNALRVYDKVWMINTAADIGIPTPATWKELSDVISYPVFYKTREEWGGGPRGIVKNRNELSSIDTDKLIFQEIIAGKGTYGVSFLANHGRILASHTHYERESFPKEGGSAVIIENFSDERILNYTRSLLKALDYSGWGLAEYKYCPNREDFVFMEINAKFWASCEFTFRNNPDFLKLLFDIDSREKPVQRMVFLERSIQRGTYFMIRHLPVLFHGTIHVYPGWMFFMLANILPRTVRRMLRRMKLWN